MNKVIIKRCEEYDLAALTEIVRDGARRLDFAPSGKQFVKPNVVYAADPRKYGTGACTHPTLTSAAVTALSKIDGVSRIDIGEKSAVGVPTRFCYGHAGYYRMMKPLQRASACPVDLFCMEEERRDVVFIGGAVHDRLRVSRKMARADGKVYLPKLKCHCVSNMTGAVKLNIGICCDDDRSIRHDFMLDEKIVDLLEAGYPDFIVMDAIDVGVGNEAYPVLRKLGLVIMGRNPVAVDLVGAKLLGFELEDVPYLKRAVERGYQPAGLAEVEIEGDLQSIGDLEDQARRLMPYNDEYTSWQDVDKELKLRQSPMRFFWGPYKEGGERCLTGCVMGIKMFLASLEKCGGAEAFKTAKPVVFVIGKVDERIDAAGHEVYLIGSCARAEIVNAKKVTRLKKCFTTASDMALSFGHKLGMPFQTRELSFMAGYLKAVAGSSVRKTLSLRYAQDIGAFLTGSLIRRL